MPKYSNWKYRRTGRAADAIRRRRQAAGSVVRYNPRLSLTSYKFGIHKHVCGATPQEFALTPTLGVGYAISFSFNQIPNFSSTYSNIYDQVRIDMAEVTIVPSWNTMQPLPGANALPSRPQLFGAVDKSVATVPGALGTILQYANHKMSSGTMRFKLRPEMQAIQSDTVTGDPTYQVKNADGWVNTDIANNMDILHNGIRLWCDYDFSTITAPNPPLTYRVFIKIYFSGKCQN